MWQEKEFCILGNSKAEGKVYFMCKSAKVRKEALSDAHFGVVLIKVVNVFVKNLYK